MINQSKLFVQDQSHIDGKILIIKEDENSVYAYILNNTMTGIKFDGFVCSVTDPFNNQLDLIKIK